MTTAPPPHQGSEPPSGEPHRRPRWVTASVVVAVLCLAAFLVLHLTGGGFGGHLPAGGH